MFYLYLLMDIILVTSAFWLLSIMLMWTWVYKYLFKFLLSLILDVSSGNVTGSYGEEIIGLISLEISISFFWVAVGTILPFYLTESRSTGFQLLYVFTTNKNLFWFVLLWLMIIISHNLCEVINLLSFSGREGLVSHWFWVLLPVLVLGFCYSVLLLVEPGASL